MDNSTVLIPITITAIAVVVVLIWYLRYRQNKLVVERVRRAPRSYTGPRRIYQIRINQTPVYMTPPPTFSKALKYPTPSSQEFESPPPTYQEYLILSAEGLYSTNYPQQLTSSISMN